MGDPPSSGRPEPRLRRVEEIEESLSRRQRYRTRRTRRNRILKATFIVAALSFLAGTALGSAGSATQEQLTQAAISARERDNFISSEVNRTLLQLWKMEDLEALRGSGRIR